jgi:hypothetical protein
MDGFEINTMSWNNVYRDGAVDAAVQRSEGILPMVPMDHQYDQRSTFDAETFAGCVAPTALGCIALHSL